jgi:hypothetical protein
MFAGDGGSMTSDVFEVLLGMRIDREERIAS